MKEQLSHLNTACRFYDYSQWLHETVLLQDIKKWSGSEIAVQSKERRDSTHAYDIAQSTAWTRWFVEQACTAPLRVENGTLLQGKMTQTLPTIGCMELRECTETIVLQIMKEMIDRMDSAMMEVIRALSAPTAAIPIVSKAIRGGNSEGLQYATEVLCTFYEHPLATDVAALRKQALQLGVSIREGMLCHVRLQKILDAFVFSQCRPFEIDLHETGGKPGLRLREEVVRYVETVAPLFKNPLPWPDPLIIINALKQYAESSGTPADGMEDRIQNRLIQGQTDPLSTQKASKIARYDIERTRFSADLPDKLAYVGIVSLDQINTHALNPLEPLLGCPLHHAGNFGKWYRFAAEPLTEWYLGQQEKSKGFNAKAVMEW